jgi:hypothetical protein
MSAECEVCEGHGSCAIFDKHGCERYSVTCPHCAGDGEIEPDEPNDPTLPPLSTAARIASMDHLRAWVANENAKVTGEAK